MPRPRGGPLTKDGSTTISVRVSNELARAVTAVAEGSGAVSTQEWLRALLRQATGRSGQLGGAHNVAVEHSEGWKAGWSHANAQFRQALREVIASDTPEPT